MAEPSCQNPNQLIATIPQQDSSLLPPPPPPRAPASSSPFPKRFSRPKLRVTSEFDSDSLVFFNKVSCKLFDSLAKLKVSFQNNAQREVLQPQVSLTSKHLSIHYDVEENNALVKSSVDIGPRLQLRALHDVKAQEGEVAMVANMSQPGYALELSSLVPVVGYPKATLRFPLGEVSLQEKEEEEKNRMLSINGILKGQVLNGLCTAQYTDEELRLRYCYKDEALSFIPSVSLPSNAVSFAFKRRFSPSDKLSYCYNFDSNYWNAVYKRTYGKDYKFKAGYDSEVRLGWASLWNSNSLQNSFSNKAYLTALACLTETQALFYNSVKKTSMIGFGFYAGINTTGRESEEKGVFQKVGDEAGKAKTAPMKMKVQFMLQVPQDDIKSSALMFRVKKRWDF